MATDIFPDIKIPVIAVTFQYSGISPDEMAGRITSPIERYLTTIVNDVEHAESQTYPGVTVIKVFFQPGVDINLAMSQVTGVLADGAEADAAGRECAADPQVQRVERADPPARDVERDASPSRSCSTSATSSSARRSPRSRARRSRIRSAAPPVRFRWTCAPTRSRAHGLSAADVNTAIGNQNLVLPAGTQKIGDFEYNVKLNASPLKLEELNDLPIKFQNGAVTTIRDVAFVHDGHPPQTNIVRVDGRRAVLMSIQKTGSASTLDIVSSIKEKPAAHP